MRTGIDKKIKKKNLGFFEEIFLFIDFSIDIILKILIFYSKM